jgi:hypothetical protein
MFGVPVKTRLPLEAWVAAAVVALVSTLSSLMEKPAASIATDEPPPVERAARVWSKPSSREVTAQILEAGLYSE